MQNWEDRIREELKTLIARGDEALNVVQNKQKVTAYLYIIFSLTALSFFGLFAIGPTISTISDLNKQYAEEQIALEKLRDKNTALKALSAEYINIQQDLVFIDYAIPKSPKIAELTRQLETLSTQNSLIIQKLDTGLIELFPAKNVNSPIFSFTFSIGVTGSEQNINTFITQLINMSRIIGMEKLTTSKNQEILYTASITGRAFFYKE